MMKSPKIRFKGFDGDWEQRKVGDLYEVNRERNENLIGYDKTFSIATMTYKDEGNGASEDSLKTYKVLRVGDVAFEGHTNKEFQYGRFVLNDVGDGIMSPRFSTLRPKNDMPISFWKHYIHYEPIMRHKLVNSTKAGTMMHELVADDFFKQEILVPSHEEQQKIGDYLNSLDHLITLHQKKFEQLTILKKYMLQKMFPQNGSDKPEIRFDGFTDDWEQRKLSDVVDVRSGRDYKHLEEGDIPVYGTGGYMLSVSEALSDDEDAIGIGRKGTIDNPYILRAPFWTVDTLFYAVPREKHDLNFVYGIFQNINWKAKDESTGVPSLSKATINAVSTMTPDYEEQRLIGEYFSNLDHLITLHQQKCDELRNAKKFMLQNMFI